MKITFFNMLIEGAADASRRTRWVFPVAIVASVAQLTVVYNFAFSQVRPYIESLVLEVRARPKDPSTYLDELRASMIKSWVEQLNVNSSLFGIKLSAGDAATVGSVALLIVSVWLFFCIRRENHIIGKALSLAEHECQETRAYVLHGIANSQVFATLTDDDTPLEFDDTRTKKSTLLRALAIGLIYLPAITPALMIAVDIYSVFGMKALLRGHAESIFELIQQGQAKTLASALDMFQSKLLIQVVLLAFIAHICRSVHVLQRGTEGALRMAVQRGFAKTTPEVNIATQPSHSAGLAT